MLQEPGEHSGRLTPEELEKVEMMHKYVLSNAHFYCETADISRPFPSSNPVDQPSWEFVWNRWLSAPLRTVDLPTHCPHLMQVFGVLSAGICLSVSMPGCLSLCAYVCMFVVHVPVPTSVFLWPCLTAGVCLSNCHFMLVTVFDSMRLKGSWLPRSKEHAFTQNNFKIIRHWASPEFC